MKISRNVMKIGICAAAMLAVAGVALAQMGGMMGGGGAASAFRGIWSPTVGQGAEYQMTDKQGPKELTIAIVGKEEVTGNTGYWMEITTKDPRSGGDLYMKFLVVTNGGVNQNVRMIMQTPGRPPMEMDMNAMQAMGGGHTPPPQSSDVSKEGKDLGSESVTVPAGTFTCEHFQSAQGDDVWISKQVSPWGLVKMNGKNTSMVLEKTISDAHDMITGTPQVIQMPNMGGMGGQH